MDFDRRLRKIFMTVVAAASLSGGFGTRSLYAQSPVVPAQDTSLSAVPSVTQADSKDISVKFKTVKNTDKLVRQYAFLDSLVTSLKTEADELKAAGDTVNTSISIATVKLGGKDKAEILFVNVSGSLYSGALGSSVDVYIRQEGQDFKPALNIVAFNDIRVRPAQDGKPVSLLLATGDGTYKLWALDKQKGIFNTQAVQISGLKTSGPQR